MELHVPRRDPRSLLATARTAALLVLAVVVLLALGRLLVASAPVSIELVAEGRSLSLAADGLVQQVQLAEPLVAVRPVAPVAYRREHQIDGSDSTNTLTFDPGYFASFGDSLYYRFQALLREEWRYSVWRNLVVRNPDGRVLVQEAQPADEAPIALPDAFRLTVELERPEIPRVLELFDASGRVLTLEVNRNDKLIRFGERRFPEGTDLLSWYFPNDWRSPLATLADLLTRALALALGLILVVGALAAVLPGRLSWTPGWRSAAVVVPLGLSGLLAASVYAAVALFDRAPHILDAVSYYFQAKTFASGALWAPASPISWAFPIPFAVEYEDRWFSQYPPGAAAVLALGFWGRVPWLVQPVLGVGAALLTYLAAARQYGRSTALLALLLVVTSPFAILQAGLFLSHLPALFFGALAIYGATRYAERPSAGWAAVLAVGLGLVLLTREVVAVLYAVSVVGYGLWRGLERMDRVRRLDLALVAAIGVGFLALYGAYNAALTGAPWVLPRHLFNSRDLYGFGPDIGFYGQHTIASGLVNAEQQLTSLAIYLAGWPFGFSLALPLLPFLTRRWSGWDGAHGLLVLLFVLAYTAYFYHGIVVGPRYYFEALPSLAMLTARGFVTLAESVTSWLAGLGIRDAWLRARQAALVILTLLLACNALYFLPRQTTLYAGWTGLPGGGPVLDETVGYTLAGRTPLLDNALVVTEEWWLYVLYFAVLNCPRLDCGTVYAYGPDPEIRFILRTRFPERDWYNVYDRRGVLRVEPGTP